MSPRPIRIAAAGLIALPLALTLGGCGKKPDFVDPPQGRAQDQFPRPYPNPATDPEPAPKTRTP